MVLVSKFTRNKHTLLSIYYISIVNTQQMKDQMFYYNWVIPCLKKKTLLSLLFIFPLQYDNLGAPRKWDCS